MSVKASERFFFFLLKMTEEDTGGKNCYVRWLCSGKPDSELPWSKLRRKFLLSLLSSLNFSHFFNEIFSSMSIASSGILKQISEDNGTIWTVKKTILCIRIKFMQSLIVSHEKQWEKEGSGANLAWRCCPLRASKVLFQLPRIYQIPLN